MQYWNSIFTFVFLCSPAGVFLHSLNRLGHEELEFDTSSSLLTVNLYYETLCPGCKQFSKDQLCPTWEKMRQYFQIEFVPYGNAQTNRTPSGDIKIRCQHGPPECEGNRIQSCALAKLSNDQSIRFICCMESSPDLEEAGPTCAKQLGIDYDKLQNCADSKEGEHLHYLNGVKTSKLKPKHKWVPWILFNGEYNLDDMKQAQEDLVPVLCKYLKEKPKECNEI